MPDDPLPAYEGEVRDLLYSALAVLSQMCTILRDIEVLKLDSLIGTISDRGSLLTDQLNDLMSALKNGVGDNPKELVDLVSEMRKELRNLVSIQHKCDKSVSTELNNIQWTMEHELASNDALVGATEHLDKIVETLADLKADVGSGRLIKELREFNWDVRVLTFCMVIGFVFLIGTLRHWF